VSPFYQVPFLDSLFTRLFRRFILLLTVGHAIIPYAFSRRAIPLYTSSRSLYAFPFLQLEQQ
jgi:hypothetical protein